MKMQWMILLVGVSVLAMILPTGYPTVAAAPTGEVKTVAAVIGKEIPIPWFEMAASSNDWMQLLYDHLVGTTPDGKFSPDLGLANKWEMSRDGLTWTFTVRKGVKFHDGVELTAKDVKFSIEQFMTPEASFHYSAPFLKGAVNNIEAKDPYTVVIRCKKPTIFMLNWLSNMESTSGQVVPKDYFERVGKDEFQKHPIGSGPYKFHSQMVGSFIKLEATEKHWRDGVPRYKYMTCLIIPEESSRIAMLRTGEADISLISREAVKDALNAGLNIVSKECGQVLVFHPNMQWTSPAFSDIRFRKALNLAIDREAIIRQVFAGLAKPIATYPGSNIFVVGGDRRLKPYSYDPQEAKRLIKEGGWEGHEFGLLSYDRPGCPEFPKVVEALAGYWEKIGLKPKMRLAEYAVWAKAWGDRKTQNTVHGYNDTSNPEAVTLLEKMSQKWHFNNKSGRSTVNISELNERFEKAEKSMDIAEISKLLAEIYRYAYDHYLMVPICEIPDELATTKRIPRWDPGLRRLDRNYYDLIKQR